MSSIDEKVKKLLEYDLQPTLRGGWKITEEMRVLIREIAEECNSLEVTQKINPRVLLFLRTGKYPSNNWLKMHGGIMERRIQVDRLRKNKRRKKKYDRIRTEEEA